MWKLQHKKIWLNKTNFPLMNLTASFIMDTLTSLLRKGMTQRLTEWTGDYFYILLTVSQPDV